MQRQFDIVREQLAATGELRVAVNMSNFLLVNAIDAQGNPDGVSPRIGQYIADKLEVPVRLVTYHGPGQIADAACHDEWDIANIAAAPERAKHIHFSQAYCEIQASYLVPPGSGIRSVQEVDRPEVRIAVKARAAYDLWLSTNLQHASLHRASSHDETFELFKCKRLDALAGLRPKLIEQQQLMPGSTLFDESFTAVKQAVGCKPEHTEAAVFIENQITELKRAGVIAGLIEQFDVTGKLSLASC